MLAMLEEKCPICGTHGRRWNQKPAAWMCPKCSSVFSKFGMVLESEHDPEEFWS